MVESASGTREESDDRPAPWRGATRRTTQTEPAIGGEPDVIVVPYRAARAPVSLLPPLLIVLLGTAFLAYRARSADWRGISSFFEPRPRQASPPVLPLARVVEPSRPAPVRPPQNPGSSRPSRWRKSPG